MQAHRAGRVGDVQVPATILEKQGKGLESGRENVASGQGSGDMKERAEGREGCVDRRRDLRREARQGNG